MNEHNLVQVTKILHVQTEQKLLKREKGSLEEEELKTSFGKKKDKHETFISHIFRSPRLRCWWIYVW